MAETPEEEAARIAATTGSWLTASGPKGDKGDTGAAGAAGAAGAKGDKGDTGTAGAAGSTGATGSAGATGSQGPQGTAGATGSAGSTGATGSQGIQGATGATGAAGATGSQGAKGDKGDTGDAGAAGSAGATGSQGIQGVAGATGSTGAQGATGPGDWDTMVQVSGSDAATTGQSLVNITGLTAALLANHVYEFEAELLFTTSADTTGIKAGVNYSAAGATFNAIKTANTTGATVTSEDMSVLNSGSAAFATAASGIVAVNIKGFMTTGANAGNLTIQHLKVTSGTSTVKKGSTLKVRQVA